MSEMLENVARHAESLTRRRFIKSAVGASVAVSAWAAGVLDAFASCGIPNCCSNPYSRCNPNCGSLRAVACCCLEYQDCPGGTCCNNSNSYCWYCVDCSLRDWECIECPACNCSAANFLGRTAA